MSNLAMYEDDLGGFTDQDFSFKSATPALVGGGSAAVIVVGVRGLAPAGTWWSRHAGLLGAGGGAAVALAAKQGTSGIAAALLVGLIVEGVEQITRMKMTS